MTPTRCATLLLPLSCLLAAACDGGPQEDAIPARFQSFARAVEEERIALGAPGMAVAVVEHGEVTFARGFGRKDASRPEPVRPSTLFRIGSVTKMLTAMAVLSAVQDGKVDLDEPITTYVPTFHLNKTPGALSGITVRHLLSHASGISDYGETNAPVGEQTDAALEQFLTGRFADIGYVASPPGAVYAYANPNFMLAGLIAEKALGKPYRTLMRDRVLAPLGLDRTFFLASEVLADGDYAVGSNCTTQGDPNCYDPKTPSVVKPDTYENPWARPAGWAWSSVLDLAKVARFLVHGQPSFMREDLWTAMTSAQISTKDAGDVVSYGFGVVVTQGLGGGPGLPYRATKTVSHDGDIAGFSAGLFCLAAVDACVIYLANSNNAHLGTSLLVAIQTLANLPAPEPAPDLSPKPERYPLYAGRYEDPFQIGQVTISTDGAKLYIELPVFDASNTPYDHELVPAEVDNFTVTVAGVARPLTFLADSKGVYTYIRSRPYLAARTASP